MASTWEEGGRKYEPCRQGNVHWVKHTGFLWTDDYRTWSGTLLLGLSGSCAIRGWWFCFFFLFCFGKRAWWRPLSPHCPQRAGLFAPTQICLFFWEPSEKQNMEGKKKRYAVKRLKYNLIWAKCSPQHPKNETRGHRQPLITLRGWRRLAAAQGC